MYINQKIKSLNKSFSIITSNIYYKSIGRFLACWKLYCLDLSEFSEKVINYKIDNFSFFIPGEKEINLFKKLYEKHNNKFIDAKRRLEANNYFCFAYRDNNTGNIASAHWLVTKRLQNKNLRKDMIFKDDEAMTLDSYTHPDYRRRGLHKNMNICMLHWIKENTNFRYIYSVFRCYLTYTEKIQYQLGYKPIETAIYYKKGSFNNFINSVLSKLKLNKKKSLVV
jgi:hypothetical protein